MNPDEVTPTLEAAPTIGARGVVVDVVRVPSRPRVAFVGYEPEGASPALAFVAACLVVALAAAVLA